MMNKRGILFVLLFLVCTERSCAQEILDEDRSIISDIIDGILQPVLKILQGVFNQVNTLTQDVSKTIEETMKNLNGRLEETISKGADSVRNISKAVEGEITEAEKQGLISAECASNGTGQVEGLGVNASSDLAKCQKAAVSLVAGVVRGVMQLLGKLSDIISNATNDVRKCVPSDSGLLNIIGITSCVHEEVSRILSAVTGLFSDVQKALAQVLQASETAASQATACVSDVVKGVVGAVEDIQGQMKKKCMSNSTQGTTAGYLYE